LIGFQTQIHPVKRDDKNVLPVSYDPSLYFLQCF